MQKIATKVFIISSLVFGVLGMVMVATIPGQNQNSSNFHTLITRLLLATVFIILPSFALSVAAKYLKSK